MENKEPTKDIKKEVPTYGFYPYYNSPCEEDEIDLYELWLVLKKRKWTIFVTTFLFTLSAVIYILISPPVYKTEAKIVPLIREKKGASLLGNLPIDLPLPSKASSTLTVETILKSRTLRERLIKELNLLPILFKDQWDNKTRNWKNPKNAPTILDGANKLKNLISVSTDKKSAVITLSVEFPENPWMAYIIANQALKDTQEILNEKTWTLAKKYRKLLEKQLVQVYQKMEELEQIYKQFLTGKIKEVPIIVDEVFIKQLSEENKEFKGKLPKKLLLNNTSIVKLGINRFQIRSIPNYQFNYQRLEWQWNLLKELLTSLTKSYLAAKSKEVKEQIAFQVVDPPYVPPKNKPAKPKKKLILAVAVISGFFLGIFLAFFREWLENVKTKLNQTANSV